MWWERWLENLVLSDDGSYTLQSIISDDLPKYSFAAIPYRNQYAGVFSSWCSSSTSPTPIRAMEFCTEHWNLFPVARARWLVEKLSPHPETIELSLDFKHSSSRFWIEHEEDQQLALLGQTLPALYSLILQNPDPYFVSALKPALTQLSNLSLGFSRDYPDISSTLLKSPNEYACFPHLLHLSILCWEPLEKICQLLCACPNLTAFSLLVNSSPPSDGGILIDPDSHPLTNPFLTLPASLEYFSLSFGSSLPVEDVRWLIQDIFHPSVPCGNSLSFLELRLGRRNQYKHVQEFFALLSSRPNLKSFSTSDFFSIDDPTALKQPHSFLSLDSLRLSSPVNMDTFCFLLHTSISHLFFDLLEVSDANAETLNHHCQLLSIESRDTNQTPFRSLNVKKLSDVGDHYIEKWIRRFLRPLLRSRSFHTINIATCVAEWEEGSRYIYGDDIPSCYIFRSSKIVHLTLPVIFDNQCRSLRRRFRKHPTLQTFTSTIDACGCPLGKQRRTPVLFLSNISLVSICRSFITALLKSSFRFLSIPL